jgi:hypothetical protein
LDAQAFSGFESYLSQCNEETQLIMAADYCFGRFGRFGHAAAIAKIGELIRLPVGPFNCRTESVKRRPRDIMPPG